MPVALWQHHSKSHKLCCHQIIQGVTDSSSMPEAQTWYCMIGCSVSLATLLAKHCCLVCVCVFIYIYIYIYIYNATGCILYIKCTQANRACRVALRRHTEPNRTSCTQKLIPPDHTPTSSTFTISFSFALISLSRFRSQLHRRGGDGKGRRRQSKPPMARCEFGPQARWSVRCSSHRGRAQPAGSGGAMRGELGPW
jgi:hypothetical protein